MIVSLWLHFDTVSLCSICFCFSIFLCSKFLNFFWILCSFSAFCISRLLQNNLSMWFIRDFQVFLWYYIFCKFCTLNVNFYFFCEFQLFFKFSWFVIYHVLNVKWIVENPGDLMCYINLRLPVNVTLPENLIIILFIILLTFLVPIMTFFQYWEGLLFFLWVKPRIYFAIKNSTYMKHEILFHIVINIFP